MGCLVAPRARDADEGRLAGRMLPNGYWEVFYPYRYTFGTRGPTLQRYRKLPEHMKEHST